MFTVQRFVNIWHPERFHDPGKKRPYFEGWYYKIVSADRQHALAVIPGVFLDGRVDDHSFIQVLDGSNNSFNYRFPYSSFHSPANCFCVTIADNTFSLDRIKLQLSGDGPNIAGVLTFGRKMAWPVTLFSPGVMGWYSFIPTMECYHGVLSFDHRIEGSLLIDGKEIDFSGGRGYMEKDWGVSFPLAYVWLQCNHFSGNDISLMVSVARIPWKRSAFRGFLIGLKIGQKLHRLTTYTGAVIDTLKISDNTVYIEAHDRKIRLQLQAKRTAGGTLYGPTGKEMHQHVAESLSSQLGLTVWENGGVIFEGKGDPAALEVHGRMELLQE